jgi:DNA mismatch repair protein MutL
MTVQQASSQQLLFPLDLFFQQPKWSLSRVETCSGKYRFVFEELVENHVVISGTPVNVTESEVSLVLEQLLSDLHDGIPDSSFSQNDTIAKSSMAA